VPSTAHAASSSDPSPSFGVRETLTSMTELRGTVSFARPAGWTQVAGGGRHSYVRFRVVEGACALDVHASMRGKATRLTAGEQVPRGERADLMGSGSRPGGAWGTIGPSLTGGEGLPDITGMYGMAAIRVAAKRYGQLRIFASLRGCDAGTADAAALLDKQGRTLRQLNHALKTAKTSLRIVRVG